MRAIAIAVSKGGVAKSTTAVHLSAALAESGLRTLVVDTDSQGHVAGMLGVEDTDGLARLLLGEIDLDEAVIEARDNMWVLPGSHALTKVNQDIGRRDFQPKFHICIIDCAPGWNSLLVNALVAADEVLSPVSMEALAVSGLGSFLKTTAPIRQATGLEIRHVLPTFFDRRVKKSGLLLDQLKWAFGKRLCDPIRYSVRMSEAPAWNQLVWEYEPNDRAGQDYRTLAERIAA